MTGGPAHPLTGTGGLLRLALRRDRVKLPAWVLSIAFFTLYTSSAIQIVYADPAELRSLASFMSSPAGVMMTGPGYGLDDPGFPSFFAAMYLPYLLLAVAMMSVLAVTRHTRGEEEAGRADPILAGAVGRGAPLAAAVLVGLLANSLVALLAFGTLVGAAGFPAGGAALTASGLFVTGLVFTGVAAVTAQVAGTARGAAALAGAVIATAFVIRGVGDALREDGSPLSWVSPLAWPPQTRPWVDPRWWPLASGPILALALLSLAAVLAARRDTGSALLAARRGPARASRALTGVTLLLARLERGTIVGWAVSLALFGAAYASITDTIGSAMASLPPEILRIMGGESSVLVDGYLGYVGFMLSTCTGMFTAAAMGRLVTEHSAGRTEWVLATAVSRARWLLAAILVAAAGSAAILASAGLSTGLVSALVLGRPALILECGAGFLGHVPAAWLTIGVAALLHAIRPALTPLAWILPVHGLLIGTFGVALRLPDALIDVSPYMHTAQVPLAPFDPIPVLILSATAIGFAAAALLVSSRRAP